MKSFVNIFVAIIILVTMSYGERAETLAQTVVEKTDIVLAQVPVSWANGEIILNKVVVTGANIDKDALLALLQERDSATFRSKLKSLSAKSITVSTLEGWGWALTSSKDAVKLRDIVLTDLKEGKVQKIEVGETFVPLFPDSVYKKPLLSIFFKSHEALEVDLSQFLDVLTTKAPSFDVPRQRLARQSHMKDLVFNLHYQDEPVFIKANLSIPSLEMFEIMARPLVLRGNDWVNTGFERAFREKDFLNPKLFEILLDRLSAFDLQVKGHEVLFSQSAKYDKGDFSSSLALNFIEIGKETFSLENAKLLHSVILKERALKFDTSLKKIQVSEASLRPFWEGIRFLSQQKNILNVFQSPHNIQKYIPILGRWIVEDYVQNVENESPGNDYKKYLKLARGELHVREQVNGIPSSLFLDFQKRIAFDSRIMPDEVQKVLGTTEDETSGSVDYVWNKDTSDLVIKSIRGSSPKAFVFNGSARFSDIHEQHFQLTMASIAHWMDVRMHEINISLADEGFLTYFYVFFGELMQVSPEKAKRIYSDKYLAQKQWLMENHPSVIPAYDTFRDFMYHSFGKISLLFVSKDDKGVRIGTFLEQTNLLNILALIDIEPADVKP